MNCKINNYSTLIALNFLNTVLAFKQGLCLYIVI